MAYDYSSDNKRLELPNPYRVENMPEADPPRRNRACKAVASGGYFASTTRTATSRPRVASLPA